MIPAPMEIHSTSNLFRIQSPVAGSTYGSLNTMASSSYALDCCASSETSLKGESFSLDKMLDIFNPKKEGKKLVIRIVNILTGLWLPLKIPIGDPKNRRHRRCLFVRLICLLTPNYFIFISRQKRKNQRTTTKSCVPLLRQRSAILFTRGTHFPSNEFFFFVSAWIKAFESIGFLVNILTVIILFVGTIFLKQKHGNFSFSATSLWKSSREFLVFNFNHAAKNLGLKWSNQLV